MQGSAPSGQSGLPGSGSSGPTPPTLLVQPSVTSSYLSSLPSLPQHLPPPPTLPGAAPSPTAFLPSSVAGGLPTSGPPTPAPATAGSAGSTGAAGEAGNNGNAPPAPVRIYNAVYSSVQVYECMIRGIAVMRRRTDSYVNATQILKVAGVDKGRRTKILEKEILPGKHEIVQGGYGKYQGTWIPLDRGKEIAQQYGVLELLSPLFDFTPGTSALGGVGMGMGGFGGMNLGAGGFTGLNLSGLGLQSRSYSHIPGVLAPPPIMPGSALRLLNQGRAQGLFTPSTSAHNSASSPTTRFNPSSSSLISPAQSVSPFSSNPTPPPAPQLKRARSEVDSVLPVGGTTDDDHASKRPRTDAPSTSSTPRPVSTPTPIPDINAASNSSATPEPFPSSTPVPALNSSAQPPVLRCSTKPSQPRNYPRYSDTSNTHTSTANLTVKDTRRTALIASLYQGDDPNGVMGLLRELGGGLLPTNTSAAAENPADKSTFPPFDIDTPLDTHLHTALHIAASLSRLNVVKTLLENGADIHRGNHLGETPLMRAVLSTGVWKKGTLGFLLDAVKDGNRDGKKKRLGLGESIYTLDTSGKSVLHHIALVAGVRTSSADAVTSNPIAPAMAWGQTNQNQNSIQSRAPSAQYYLDTIFLYLAQNSPSASSTATTTTSPFDLLINIQDIHGDTALNIASRVGNKMLCKTLLEAGANRMLGNKLGLRPGDFGVLEGIFVREEGDVGGEGRRGAGAGEGIVGRGTATEEFVQLLRPAVPAPIQKSQDVIADITSMLSSLTTEFQLELKAKSDSLDITQTHLRAATRELAEQRRSIGLWKARGKEKDVLEGRKRGVEGGVRALGGVGTGITATNVKDEGGIGTWDWTGRCGPESSNRENRDQEAIKDAVGLVNGEQEKQNRMDIDIEIDPVLLASTHDVSGNSSALPGQTTADGVLNPFEATAQPHSLPSISRPRLITGPRTGADMGNPPPSASARASLSASMDGDADADASADDDDEADAEARVARNEGLSGTGGVHVRLIGSGAGATSTNGITTSSAPSPGDPTSPSHPSNSHIVSPAFAHRGFSHTSLVLNIPSIPVTPELAGEPDPPLPAPYHGYVYPEEDSDMMNKNNPSPINTNARVSPEAMRVDSPAPAPVTPAPSMNPMSTSTGLSPFAVVPAPAPAVPSSNSYPESKSIPTASPPTAQTLIRLRRILLFQRRLTIVLEGHLKQMKQGSAEKEYIARKIVSLCTGVEGGKVDDVLEKLVEAMESETNGVDFGRVSGFMQQVRDGII